MTSSDTNTTEPHTAVIARLISFKWLLFPFAGVMQTLSLSPFNWWPLGIVSITLVMLGLQHADSRKSLRYGWLFGLGLFGSGASWVYVSIHNFGYASVPLAVTLTVLFVAAIALFPAAVFWFYRKLFNGNDRWSAFTFPAVWVLGDWFRSWFLTGFPWLYLGYGHLDTPLSGWAGVLGVHGITFIICLSGSAIWYFICHSKLLAKTTESLTNTEHATINSRTATPSRKILPASFIASVTILWMLGAIAGNIEWGYIKNETPLSVATVQGNIPQELKWKPEYRLQSIKTYQQLTAPHWGKQLIVWPETAIPVLYDQAIPLINQISEQAAAQGSTLISGIPYRQNDGTTNTVKIHNSIFSTGSGDGIYHKQKLVPFGEYVPLEELLRGLISFFDLPMSSFSAGDTDQPPLRESIRSVAPYICYEIVYPDFVMQNAHTADYLLTISNDSWFGSSIGPLQHLEMAQMRALENARYLIRGTNNGISAIIGPDGSILSQSEQFVQTVLTGEVYAMGGRTPFSYLGSTPILLLCAIILIARRLWLHFRIARPA